MAFRIPKIIEESKWIQLFRNYSNVMKFSITCLHIVADPHSIHLELLHACIRHYFPKSCIQVLITILIYVHQCSTIIPSRQALFKFTPTKNPMPDLSFSIVDFIIQAPIASHDCTSISTTYKIPIFPLHYSGHLVCEICWVRLDPE